jgi:hypothetical protein
MFVCERLCQPDRQLPNALPVAENATASIGLPHAFAVRIRLGSPKALDRACPHRSRIRGVEQSLRLVLHQPVAKAYSDLLHAFGSSDSRRSALRRPQSEASYASRRTAPNRRLIVPGANLRDSRCMRYRRTTVRFNDSRGSEQYHSMNSSMACRYPRCASEELRLFRTDLLGRGRVTAKRFWAVHGVFVWRLGIVRGPPNRGAIMAKLDH